MPDPVLFLEAMAAAAFTAAVLVLLCGWPWRAPNPARTHIGFVLGVGLGFFVGSWLLGVRPNWPPREDQDRLLFILVPAVVGMEILGAFRGPISWLAVVLRLVCVVGAVRLLLHGSVYLTEPPGPGSLGWTESETWQILGGLAVALALVWIVLSYLAKGSTGRAVPLAMALTCAGAAVTIMLSGYATGGQMGLPLAAALAGAWVASWALSGHPSTQGAIGVAVVGLFALLVMGRFFGELITANAVLLFFAPLLCGVPELPPRLRGLGKVILVAIPVAIAIMAAQGMLVPNSARTASTSDPSSAAASAYDDYIKSGK